MSIETKLEGGLIVSCQALPDEPLHSSFIMGRMALAAYQAGASAIRANTVEDIFEIKKNVSLPIIGIIKKDYDDSKVFITPTIKEIGQLVEAGVDIIATDATKRTRPNDKSLKSFYEEIRNRYGDIKLMADCSTIEEALIADEMGFDFLGTTLVGYTSESASLKIEDNDFEIIRKIIENVKHPVIAEGNIDSPQKAKRVLELGCLAVVVGSSITRPQIIAKKYVDEVKLYKRS